MSVTVDGGNEVVTRQPRQPRAEQQATDTTAPPIEVSEAPSAEADDTQRALAASQKQLAQQDKELEAARARERDARQAAQRARDEAARVAAARVTDRQAVAASAIETAKADEMAAKQALRVAREAGDLDAELAAYELLQSAIFRRNHATNELSVLKEAIPDPTSGAGAPRQPAQQQGPSEASRRWLDEHPAFFSDGEYHAAATRAANAAVAVLGREAEGSQEYVDYINGVLERAYGPGHGQGRGQRQETAMPAERRHDATSSAGPTSRGGGGSSGGGGGTVNTGLGPVHVTNLAGGGMRIQIPPHLMEDFREGASVAGMDFNDYVHDQVRIARERQAGGNAGWVQGDGNVYR